MWRQEVLRITLVGIILGTVGVYLWKQAHQRPPLARSSPSTLTDSGPAASQNRSDLAIPAQTGPNPWQAGLGEVPSFGPAPVLSGPPPSGPEQASSPNKQPSAAASATEPQSASQTVVSSSSQEGSSRPSDASAAEATPEQDQPPPGLLPTPEQSEEAAAQIAALPPPDSAAPEQTAPLAENHPGPAEEAPPEAPWIAGARQGIQIAGSPSESAPPETPTMEQPPEPVPSLPPAEADLQVTSAQLRLLPSSPEEETGEQSHSPPPLEAQTTQPEEPSSKVSSATGIPMELPEAAQKQTNEETSSSSPSDPIAPWEITFPQPNPHPPAQSPASPPEPPKEKVSSPEPAKPSGSPLPFIAPDRCPAAEQCQAACPCAQPEQVARQAHKTLFYDNQFDYLEDPCPQTFLGDRLKRLQIRPWAILDLGGEYRLRHHSERNHRGIGLTGQDDDFLLHRTRLYANLELGELARIYAEMNDALSTNETYLPRPWEEDRTELENLFIDVPLLGWRTDGLVARLGRQELLYGAGRLVSPLDWANTRRSFEGYKLFWQGPFWSVDAFWVQPVYPNPAAFDSPDQSQQFMGLYLVRRLGQEAVLEGYYLRLVEEDGAPDFDFHTFGLRSQQEYNNWLGELEAAVQFGSYGAAEHLAGMYTIGVGRRFPCLPGKPIFWMYYDWASGDPTQGNGFHHLFPDSHQYLGYMDLFGRRNIEDWSFHLLVHPHRDWTLRLAWHIFHRQHPLDVPYGVDMTPLVAAPGGSGDYGQELDLVLQWTIRPRAELQFGYSRFFAGQFFRTNPTPAPYQDDADFFYTQFSLRF